MHISSLQRVFSIAAANLREVGENWEYVSKLLQGNVIGKKNLNDVSSHGLLSHKRNLRRAFEIPRAL